MKYQLLITGLLIINLSCSAQTSEMPAVEGFGVMFYNLENLYDTINDPAKDDEVFLPNADRQWNASKYDKKLENLSKVIATGADMLPTLVGLCEVENEKVVKDLANTTNLKPEITNTCITIHPMSVELMWHYYIMKNYSK